MTKLSFKYYFSTSCKIKVENTTGIKSLSNPDGFLSSDYQIDHASTTDSNNFSLAEIYLFTAIIYNPFGKDPIVEQVYKVKYSSLEGSDLAKLSYKPIHSLSNDGYYTVVQFIALDKLAYNTNYNSLRFNGNKYIVFDGDLSLYYTNTLINEASLKYSVLDLLKVTDTSITNMIAWKSVFSTCKLYACYIKMVETSVIEGATSCHKKSSDVASILILYSTLSAIKYRVQLCEYSIAQRYVEWVSQCGNYCDNIISNSRDCNCG